MAEVLPKVTFNVTFTHRTLVARLCGATISSAIKPHSIGVNYSALQCVSVCASAARHKSIPRHCNLDRKLATQGKAGPKIAACGCDSEPCASSQLERTVEQLSVTL